MYTIEKKFTFEAAHLLEGLDANHPCGTVHGHSYKMFIEIVSHDIDENGFVIDFGKLKEFKKVFIDEYLDHALIITKHSCLNNQTVDGFSKIYVLPKQYNNTTVENLCHHITFEVIRFLSENVGLLGINICKVTTKIYETENNSGSFSYLY